MDELRVMLANHDPATRRLFPTAYVEHPDLDAEYQRMVGDDLLRRASSTPSTWSSARSTARSIDRGEARGLDAGGQQRAAGPRHPAGRGRGARVETSTPTIRTRTTWLVYEVLNDDARRVSSQAPVRLMLRPAVAA